MERYTFINKPDRIEAANEYNVFIIHVDRNDRVRVLPTLLSGVKYYTRHLTAPFRFVIDLPKHYSWF